MTADELHDKLWPEFLHMLADIWSARKESPTALGLLMDVQQQRCRKMCRRACELLIPPPAVPVQSAKPAPANGAQTRKG